MSNRRALLSVTILLASMISPAICQAAPAGPAPTQNLIANANFQKRGADASHPADFELTGAARYAYLGDPSKEISGWGVALKSANSAGATDGPGGTVSQTITGIDSKAGRWFRFSFRGLPEDHFAVEDDGLYMKVEFFGDGGKKSFDGKVKKIYSAIEQDRRDLAVNGDRKAGGAAVWRTYSMDFILPFPQVDQVKLSIGFDHGNARTAADSEFFITDVSLVRIDAPAGAVEPATMPAVDVAQGKLLPIGGRWFYKAAAGEMRVPAQFDSTNVDRLLYHDGKYSAVFAGMTTAWLRAGDKDFQGNIVTKDQFIADNVTISFDATSMIIHSRNLPNHPTGKFPETAVARGNPNYIQEKQETFYIPLDPKVNLKHIVTATDNSNHALPMGPIGVAVNGVVFFNPFDAGSQDATNMMDRCCGHPAPDGTYHYHKYPICINSPWMDEGAGHSPLIGWAFDGFPVYGPYEKAGVMAKDVVGETALNDFNLHFDRDRGWHYHVTPGKFPYIIGGYWGTEMRAIPREWEAAGPADQVWARLEDQWVGRMMARRAARGMGRRQGRAAIDRRLGREMARRRGRRAVNNHPRIPAIRGCPAFHLNRQSPVPIVRGNHYNRRKMSHPLNDEALSTIFREARTHAAWLDKPVGDDLLRKIYDLAKLGPTSANTSPMRVVFVKSKEGKEKLIPALMPGNVDKTMAAPVTAIVSSDSKFYEFIPKLWFDPKFADYFTAPGKEDFVKIHALRNGSLQGAYLIIAARALGLDAGPMSGFDNAKVDADFFPDGRWQSNFLINIGYGDSSKLRPRNARLEFEDACKIV